MPFTGLIFFSSIFFISCVPEYLVELPSVNESPYSISTASGRRDRSEFRKNLSGTSDPCRENKSCIRICDEIYLKASELDECYDSKENSVEDVLDVFEALENPKRISHLNDIDIDDFETYLKIGIQSFIDLIDPVDKDEDGDRINEDWEDIYAYGEDNARVTLEWICSKRDVRKALGNDLEDIRKELIGVFEISTCQEVREELENNNGCNFDCIRN